MNRHIFTENEFAHLGEGEVAYVRKIRSDDLARSFPALPPIEPGLELWALFGASGSQSCSPMSAPPRYKARKTMNCAR